MSAPEWTEDIRKLLREMHAFRPAQKQGVYQADYCSCGEFQPCEDAALITVALAQIDRLTTESERLRLVCVEWYDVENERSRCRDLRLRAEAAEMRVRELEALKAVDPEKPKP